MKQFIAFISALTIALLLTPAAGSAQTDPKVTICETAEADLLRLYVAIFNREHDAKGGQYWLDQYRSGLSMEDTAYWMSQGSEFQTAYKNITTNTGYVEKFYRNILGREAESSGKSYWISELDNGLEPHLAVRWIAQSPELAARYPYQVSDCTSPVQPVASTSTYYENCTAVWNSLGRPIKVSDLGYREGLDRDGDGVGCENDPR